MWAQIAAALTALSTLASQIIALFKKSPERVQQEKMSDDMKKREEDAHAVSDALEKGRAGDTSAINDILNKR